MKKFAVNIFIALATVCFLNFACLSDENSKETELNAFSGLFDFGDNKQKSVLFGLQHQNEELFRKSFIGKLSPITGGFLTEKNAFYLYTGVQAE